VQLRAAPAEDTAAAAVAREGWCAPALHDDQQLQAASCVPHIFVGLYAFYLCVLLRVHRVFACCCATAVCTRAGQQGHHSQQAEVLVPLVAQPGAHNRPHGCDAAAGAATAACAVYHDSRVSSGASSALR
jgi:hypothetical protein